MHGAGSAKPALTAVPGRAGHDQAFERFVAEAGPRLGRALAALYGFEDGRDATAEATSATAIIGRAFVDHYGQIP